MANSRHLGKALALGLLVSASSAMQAIDLLEAAVYSQMILAPVRLGFLFVKEKFNKPKALEYIESCADFATIMVAMNVIFDVLTGTGKGRFRIVRSGDEQRIIVLVDDQLIVQEKEESDSEEKE